MHWGLLSCFFSSPKTPKDDKTSSLPAPSSPLEKPLSPVDRARGIFDYAFAKELGVGLEASIASMADPLSAISGVAGIITLAAATAKTLSQLIADIKDAPVEIAEANSEIKALSKLFETSGNIYGQLDMVEDKQLTATFGECLGFCLRVMEELRRIVEPFAAGNAGRTASLRWIVKRREVRRSRAQLSEGKASLALAIGSINMHLSNTSHSRIRQDVMNLGDDMKRRDEKKVDLASTRGRRGSLSNVTDAGLPLRRFLETAHEWENASMVGEVVPPTEAATEAFADIDEATITSERTLVEPQRSPMPVTLRVLRPPQELDLPPLLQAALRADIGSMSSLLQSGAPTSSATKDGLTALHIAADIDNVAISELLLSSGASLNEEDNARRTPLLVALEARSSNVANLLIGRGCAIGPFTRLAAEVIQLDPHDEDVRSMLGALSRRLDRGREAPYVLHRAAKNEGVAFLKALLDEGFDPNARDDEGVCPIHFAVSACRLTETKILIDRGADPNAYVPRGSAVTRDRDVTPLMLAGQIKGHLDILQLLLDSGANPSFVHPYFDDMVLQAVCAFDANVGKALIAAGAKVDHPCRNGLTALFWGIMCDNPPLVEHILGASADTTRRFEDGKSYLHKAVELGRVKQTRQLVRFGADMDAKDRRGRTALHYAVHHGKKDMVKILLEGNANPLVEDDDGSTPMQEAEGRGEEIVALFRKREE